MYKGRLLATIVLQLVNVPSRLLGPTAPALSMSTGFVIIEASLNQNRTIFPLQIFVLPLASIISISGDELLETTRKGSLLLSPLGQSALQ